MKYLIEVWCSPLRKEIYSTTEMTCSTSSYAFEDELDMFMNDELWNVFEEDFESEGGLWKLIFELDINYTQDYFGEYDTEFEIGTVFFKSKCKSWSHTKDMWLQLSGKYDDYYSRPWMK